MHANTNKSLMDRIAEDPDIINRSLADTGAAPVAVKPVEKPIAGSIGGMVKASDKMGNLNSVPLVNLLGSRAPDEAPLPAEVSPSAKNHWRGRLVFLGVGLLVTGGAASGWVWLRLHQPVKPVTPLVRVTPTASPLPTVRPTATSTPEPTPTIAPAPQEVTAPATTPTTDHPQTVVVRSASGLWLRSTPNSSSKANIIGWMPNGAQVSVDQVGDFWWHGTYGGKVGYFAVNYTR